MDIVIILKINFKNLFQIIESKKQSLATVEFLAKKQKDDLYRQIEAVKTYISKYSEKFEIIQDIGSGINYNKPVLKNYCN